MTGAECFAPTFAAGCLASTFGAECAGVVAAIDAAQAEIAREHRAAVGAAGAVRPTHRGAAGGTAVLRRGIPGVHDRRRRSAGGGVRRRRVHVLALISNPGAGGQPLRVAPHSSGCTSRSCVAKSQRWPSRSSAPYPRNPYSLSEGSASSVAPAAFARSGVHLGVADPAARLGEAQRLLEPERGAQPVQRRRDILVEQVRRDLFHAQILHPGVNSCQLDADGEPLLVS